MRHGGNGDDRFVALYRKHYARVYWFYRNWRLTDDEAHELAQEVFTRVWECWDEYRAEAEWSYLETIARRTLQNRERRRTTLRHNVSLRWIDDPEIAAELPSETPDYAETEQRRRLRETIEQLPEGLRQTLALWLEGFTHIEIGTLLKITPVAARTRIRDAKRVLRERLGAVLPEDDE